MKILTALFLLSGFFASAQSTLATRANTFLASLSKEQKSKTQYILDDKERFNWGFVPRERNGLTFHDFNATQRKAATALLQASLSEQGYTKATSIVELENVLRTIENRGPTDTYRDPLNYHFTVFGEPSDDKPWAWRFEGHHISINFVITKGKIESSTPNFWGSNPGVVPVENGPSKMVLKEELELGFELVNSLSAEQKKKCIFSETALPEIVSSNDRKASVLTPLGIAYSDLNEAQQKTCMKLLNTYIRNYELGFSNKLMAKIKKAGIDKLSFAWAGSLQTGAGHYYRIQGPMLLIEYDNTQNNGNHIHTTVRDLTNDFAEDILREHYAKEHK